MTDVDGTVAEFDELGDLNDKWRFRFRFFQEHGTPQFWKNSPEYRSGLLALPARSRRLVNLNWFAVFFTVFYLLYLRLWRKAVLLTAVSVAIGVVSTMLNLPGPVDSGLSVGFALFVGMRANVYYYDYRVRGLHTWAL